MEKGEKKSRINLITYQVLVLQEVIFILTLRGQFYHPIPSKGGSCGSKYWVKCPTLHSW